MPANRDAADHDALPDDGEIADRELGRPSPRPSIRVVALPKEHGGWSLTAEPVLLGLLVAWSSAGLALGAVGLLLFTSRTSVKMVMVDLWRRRWLDRTRLAAVIGGLQLTALVVLAVFAVVAADSRFWPPLALAAPLILLELWFDMRSRSRRLIPELAGTAAIGSMAAAIALAGGSDNDVAFGLWCVISARSVPAIPFVRNQIARLRGRPVRLWVSDVAHAIAMVTIVVGWAWLSVPLASVLIVGAIAMINLISSRRPPQPVVAIGIQQTVFGLLVVVVTAVAIGIG